MPRGGKPSVWGMEEISSSCELILRMLVIDDHLLGLEVTFFRRSNRSRGGSDSGPLPICGRCRPGLPRGVGRHPPRCSGYDLVERDGLQRRRPGRGIARDHDPLVRRAELLDELPDQQLGDDAAPLAQAQRSPIGDNGWLLQSLLNDASIEEIAINGLDEVCVSRTESDAPDHPPASVARLNLVYGWRGAGSGRLSWSR